MVKVCSSESDLPTQLKPSPLYPGRQVQVKLPGVLVQVASELQPPLLAVHSLLSTKSQVELWSKVTNVRLSRIVCYHKFTTKFSDVHENCYYWLRLCPAFS